MQWTDFNYQKDYRALTNKIEVKYFNGKTTSITRIVGGSILNNRDEEIDCKEIGWFREKTNYKRFNSLQKHHETLAGYDFDKLDDFEFAIYDTYTDQEDRDKIAKLFEKLKGHVEMAQTKIREESKTYLN